MKKPIFSGHESFQCKTHWLKRGYDFVSTGYNFNDDDAVVKLGVGKNMVLSIRYWMKSFALLDQHYQPSTIANYLLKDGSGYDPYFEDIGTLWLMHYLLVNTQHASIYNITFVDFHKQRNDFEKNKIQNFVKRICYDNNYQYLYNENTIKKDINVLLQNYIEPKNGNIEDCSALLLDLNLLKEIDKEEGKKEYYFNYINQNKVPSDIFLYAINTVRESNSIPFDTLLELALIFCLSNNDLLDIIKQICEKYPQDIVYSDVAGIRQLQFKRDFSWMEILNNYYN